MGFDNGFSYEEKLLSDAVNTPMNIDTYIKIENQETKVNNDVNVVDALFKQPE